MAFVRKLSLGGSGASTQGGSASTYIGDIDDIWADDIDFNILRRGDGVTPGGIIMGTSGGGHFSGVYTDLTSKPQDISTIEHMNLSDPVDPHYGITYDYSNKLEVDTISYISIIQGYVTPDSYVSIQDGTVEGQHKIISVEGHSSSYRWKLYGTYGSNIYESPFDKCIHLIWHPGTGTVSPVTGTAYSPARWHILTEHP